MQIKITGAREHNLKNIDIEFAAGLTVVTGVSGSGKTSLVFDTLYHEARRRLLGIISNDPYAYHLPPAKVKRITGLGPAIAVGQNLLNRNPNSFLASAAALFPFFRLLYARFGARYCRQCGAAIEVLTRDELAAYITRLSAIRPLTLYAPLLHALKGSHSTLLALLARDFPGTELIVDGKPLTEPVLDPALPHSIVLQIGSFTQAAGIRAVREIVQKAAELGVYALTVKTGDEEHTLCQAPVCSRCRQPFAELKPMHFGLSCTACKGKGCTLCNGTGLYGESAYVRLHKLLLTELLNLTVDQAVLFFKEMVLPAGAARCKLEITRRLDALQTVGLGYLSLNRSSPTLSRGEAQRVRLAVALTNRLEDLVHILDEPTVGQHPANVDMLTAAFRKLPGSTIFVEHDRIAARGADYAVDIGPGAGGKGGEVVFSGTPAGLWAADTLTGRCFSRETGALLPGKRPLPDRYFTVFGACKHNLKEIDAAVPVNRFTVVTGVSGSGKSTFVHDILAASLKKKAPVNCRAVEGAWLKPVLVDQSPIGKNPRSNPATYTKLADLIRDLFAGKTALSKSHFSFNRPEGACPDCGGMGAVEVKMKFLPDSWITCQSCNGRRFSEEVLEKPILLGKTTLTIADLYALPVDELLSCLRDGQRHSSAKIAAAFPMLEALQTVGLGYLSLGQPSPSLSGGEAQRIKLAKFLGKKQLHNQLFILDEPSTGLHPADLAGLLKVLDNLVQNGGTVLVVEHNTDLMRAADWIIDLGPGAGPEGGSVVYTGTPAGLLKHKTSITGSALREEKKLKPQSKPVKKQNPEAIIIRNARAHNLKGIDVEIPKGKFTVITGVSGSGKSSLLRDVLEAEARRRYLESLSLYERQGTREGPEAPVDMITGLGVTISPAPTSKMFRVRADAGLVTEIRHHLETIFALSGIRECLHCGTVMLRGQQWLCPSCGATAPIGRARHFSPTTYSAACRTCHGIGTLQIPAPEKLILHPGQPLLSGAMHSPGFFPKGFLGKPYNSGYYLVQALAVHYGFDPFHTPWKQMTKKAQDAFLFGDPTPLQVTFENRKHQTSTRSQAFPGFYWWVRDWDQGGTYTKRETCTDCGGARLRKESLAVKLAGYTIHRLAELPLAALHTIMRQVQANTLPASLDFENMATVNRRLTFLIQVGLGYLHLNRRTDTLSAGEAQRLKLAGLLGSGLTSITFLVDEPTRGMHPAEVRSLVEALLELRDEGNTVLVVEHDPLVIRSADHIIDMGPGAGREGGEVAAAGPVAAIIKAGTVTGQWLKAGKQATGRGAPEPPALWMEITGAAAHNLKGGTVRFPLNRLTGVCGVSGSGKSTLVIDTIGRALCPEKHTTSVAQTEITPGAYQSINGAPHETIIIDQTRKHVSTPADFLGIMQPLLSLYADSGDARALGLSRESLNTRCRVCNGSGYTKTDMAFLPAVTSVCEVCRGTGYREEAREITLHGYSLGQVNSLTFTELYPVFKYHEGIAAKIQAVLEAGLGYLVFRQPVYSLSGGECQRLKIARELAKAAEAADTLYILDEPTDGQHLADVARLTAVLRKLTTCGNTVIAVEHHIPFLAACDWLVELGPGGGPAGGEVIAAGTPETVASLNTPTAVYLRQFLEGV